MLTATPGEVEGYRHLGFPDDPLAPRAMTELLIHGEETQAPRDRQ